MYEEEREKKKIKTDKIRQLKGYRKDDTHRYILIRLKYSGTRRADETWDKSQEKEIRKVQMWTDIYTVHFFTLQLWGWHLA